MKKNFGLLLVIFFIFVGCGPKTSALKHFDNAKINANTIQYTKKTDYVVNNEVKAMMIATYINKIDEKYNDLKTYDFIIGIHIVDNLNFLLKKEQLTLNEEEPLKIEPLSIKDTKVKNLTLKNNWAKYYKVSFTKNKEDSELELVFNHPSLGELSISFEK